MCEGLCQEKLLLQMKKKATKQNYGVDPVLGKTNLRKKATHASRTIFFVLLVFAPMNFFFNHLIGWKLSNQVVCDHNFLVGDVLSNQKR